MIVLLFYMIIAITLTATAIAVVMSNSLAVTTVEEGNHALEVAEAGAENAIIRLLRTPGYSGETFSVGLGSAAVTVVGVEPKTIHSRGSMGSFERSVEVVVSFANGVLTVLSWQEI